MQRKTIFKLSTLLFCLVVLTGLSAAYAANTLQVEERVGEAGQTGLAIPINGEWEDDLLGFTISLQFDPDFLTLSDVSLDGTVAEDAEYFVPQWNNDTGYLTVEVIMGTEYPADFAKSLAPGSGCLLSVTYDIQADAPNAATTDLDLADGMGIPPRQNRFFWNDGSVVSPVVYDGELATIFVWASDFESDDGGFTGTGEWEWGVDPWDSSNNLWGTDLDGYYEPEACDWLFARFTVPDDYEWAFMTFQHKYKIDVGKSHGDDGGNVKGVLPVVPGTYEVLDPEWTAYDVDSLFNDCLTYEPGYSGQSAGWSGTVDAAFDLTGHISANHGIGTIYYDVRWMFGSDSWPNVSEGWFVDDVLMKAAPTAAGPFFIRGDADNNGRVDISDMVYLQDYIFGGGPPPPPPCDRGDVNDDGAVDILDMNYLTNFIFSGGDEPPWPYPEFGIDSTPDDLPLECIGGRMLSREPKDASPSDPEKLRFDMFKNKPNPFEAATEIRYSLPEDGNVRLEVFDSLGRKVATIVDEYQTAGHKTYRWDAGSVPSGVYFYRLRTDDAEATQKMTVLK